MTLVVRGEDHGAFELLEMLEPGDGHAREDAAEGEYPRRQARAPDRAHRQAAVPRWENQRLGSDPVLRPRRGLTLTLDYGARRTPLGWTRDRFEVGDGGGARKRP